MTRQVIQNKRNPIARILKLFTPKVIKDKTKYNRKQNEQTWKRTLGKSNEA